MRLSLPALVLATSSILLSQNANTHTLAFTPSAFLKTSHLHGTTTQLFEKSESSEETKTDSSSTSASTSGKDNEKSLRLEIAERNARVDAKDEINYAASIGNADTDEDGEQVVTATTVTDTVEDGEKETDETKKEDVVKESSSTKPSSGIDVAEYNQMMERITKPRAYPLFLAEKGALLLDETLSSFTKNKNDNDKIINNDKKKERIVILGTGWGAAAFLKEIDTSKFDVTVISPRNFFLFTPMLAGASVGTVEYRSITENIRGINSKAEYLEGTAVEIDPKSKSVLCESVFCEGNSCTIEDFSVDYDKLILTVGAQTNTFGIPGVREYCCFLKQVEDARKIRTAIVNCFERANLPQNTDEKRTAILTFAVIGAGPTGVEFASELRDFIEQDGPKYYPELLKYVRIKVIEASPTVLAPFDKSLQEEAIRQLTRGVKSSDEEILNLLPEKFQLTELLLNSGVSEVEEDVIRLNDGKEIPYGLAVWAAGNGPLPITLQLIDSLKDESAQTNAQDVARGRVAIDPWLRVLGGEGDILSFGDCSCITTGQLPATAQVASQQGEFLGRLLSKGYNFNTDLDPSGTMMTPPEANTNLEKDLAEKITAFAIQKDGIAAPFQFLNLGILAYTGGGSALAQLQVTPQEQGRIKGKGKIGFGLWRSVYLSKQVSWRNRILVFLDWSKTQIFGRDITRLS
jgi:NADH dehydrogenase FAD-containing subunit